jgi:D-glycero-D-manno-heptose 1,7-bisphosphate phosphatase
VKAVFLDRDGVINRMIRNGYVLNWDQFEFLPHVAEAINLLNKNNIPVYVITNQACIGRGLITKDALDAINRRMVNELAEKDASIDEVFVCPHTPEENCDCRKPKTGLFLQAKAMHPQISFKDSWFIGDTDTDVEAGHAIGCKTIKMGEKDDLLEVVKGLLK